MGYVVQNPNVPQWVDIGESVAIVGWSSYTDKLVQYLDIGSAYLVLIHISGTSNSANASVTLPPELTAVFNMGDLVYVSNNGATAVGRYSIVSGDNTIDFRTSVGGGTWSASGVKRVTVQFIMKKP